MCDNLVDPPRAASKPRAVSVLLVEDEALSAQALEECLTESGFAVTVASDGISALEAAQRNVFDVLLTDLRMPRLDGVQLIRLLRVDRPGLPVVVMTGQVPSDWEVEFQRDGEGPTRLLLKPVSLREIVGTLRMVLEAA
jgi:CheY-like chemotaxis protein